MPSFMKHIMLPSAILFTASLWVLVLDPAVALAAAAADPEPASWVQRVEDAVQAAGWAGPAVFIAIYALATVLLFPASVLTLAAGALFGPLSGTAIVSVASTTGAAAAFLVSRYLARPLVTTRLQGYPKVQAVLSSVSNDGAGRNIVLLLRLSPLFPFNVLNYALGLTAVGFWPYVLASWAGMLPGTFAYVFLGGAGRAAADAASGEGGLSITKIVLYAVGAVATIAATKLISSAANKALEQAQVQSVGTEQTTGQTRAGRDPEAAPLLKDSAFSDD